MNHNRLDKKELNKLKGQTDQPDINQNHFILRFIDFDFDPKIISDRLGLKPSSSGQKGEEYYIGTKKIPRIRDCNHWDIEQKIISNDFIGDLLDLFFKEIIIPRIELLKELKSQCKILRLTMVQYYYTGHNPGFTLTNEQIKILADINAEIDIDVYCLCEDN
nr:DUF4279 domain-containing protein [uncultured Carboxylicivirga sp.]